VQSCDALRHDEPEPVVAGFGGRPQPDQDLRIRASQPDAIIANDQFREVGSLLHDRHLGPGRASARGFRGLDRVPQQVTHREDEQALIADHLGPRVTRDRDVLHV
jgi:hypothetical protein